MQPWEREVRDRDGRWWVLRVLPFRTSDNRIDGATIVAVDIDLVRQSHDLREGRDAALAIVQAVREPLVVLDADCRVGLANDAFCTLLGETAAQIEGKHLWETGLDIWIDPEVRRALRDACAGAQPIVNLEMEQSIAGRARTLVLNTKAIVRAERPSLVLLAVSDVTDAREAETLRIDAETLRLSTSARTNSSASWRMNSETLWRPMRFALEILRRADGNVEQMTRARQVLERQVTHMVRIVDDLLDVSRITQGKVELRKERLELASLVNAAVELCRPGMTASRHTLTISLPDETVTLDGDSVRLTQVLVNLLNNAIKFTPARSATSGSLPKRSGEPCTDPHPAPHTHSRYRRRHPARHAAQDFRHVHAGRCVAGADAGGPRRRPDARAQFGGAAWRDGRGAQ